MNTESAQITVEIPNDLSGNVISPGRRRRVSMVHYAWLEHAGGRWHLLTSPFSDASAANRKWRRLRKAISELEAEGWKVVRPYRALSTQLSGNGFRGYGLKRTIH